MNSFPQFIALHLALCVAFFAVPGRASSLRCYQCSSYLTQWCDDPFDLSSVVQGRSCRKETNSTKYSTVNVLRNMFMVLGNIFPPTYYGYETYVGLYPVSNHYEPDRRRRHSEAIDAEGGAVKEAEGDAIFEWRRRRRHSEIKAVEGKSIEEVLDDDEGDEDVDEGDADEGASRRVVRQYPFPPRLRRPDDAYECFKIVVKSNHNGEERAFRGCAEFAQYDICTMVLGYSKDADKRVVSCNTCNKNKCNDASSPRGVHAKMAAVVAILLAWLVC